MLKILFILNLCFDFPKTLFKITSIAESVNLKNISYSSSIFTLVTKQDSLFNRQFIFLLKPIKLSLKFLSKNASQEFCTSSGNVCWYQLYSLYNSFVDIEFWSLLSILQLSLNLSLGILAHIPTSTIR